MILPTELVDHVIGFTNNKIFDLCLVCHYFNNNCKQVLILSNDKYPKIVNENLKQLINLTSLDLRCNKLITNEGINLINCKVIG